MILSLSLSRHGFGSTDRLAAMCMALLVFFVPCPGLAAEANVLPTRVEAQVRAADAVTLVAGTTQIRLWGVEGADEQNLALRLKARIVLDNAIGQDKVTCEIKARAEAQITAQCVNRKDMDLGLFMLQQGFSTVDRGIVYGTVFEQPYIQAEMQAQSRGAGIWADTSPKNGESSSANYLYGFGFFVLLSVMAALGALSVIVMRGFQKMVEAQKQTAEMAAREQKIREKERAIVAVMLDAELKANKTKIEAYKAVYDEMLRGLKDPDRSPKYKKSGDIIQKQPTLERSVFVRNTDKLDMLGERLSSALVHFYARIKSNPDYITIEPNTPLDEVIDTLEKCLARASRLNDLADELLELFASSGVVSEDYQE